jgi:hypothetical protein
MYQSMVTVTLRSLFVPMRYFVPARTFLGVPYRSWPFAWTFAWSFLTVPWELRNDQERSETVRNVGRLRPSYCTKWTVWSVWKISFTVQSKNVPVHASKTKDQLREFLNIQNIRNNFRLISSLFRKNFKGCISYG